MVRNRKLPWGLSPSMRRWRLTFIDKTSMLIVDDMSMIASRIMKKSKSHVTDAELEILKLLWEQPGLTARELAKAIYRDTANSHIGSVQKLIQRLEAKRLIKRDRSEFAHRFSAKVSQAEVAGMQLDELARKVTGGSLAPFISHLVEACRLSDEEKAEIQKLLGEGSRR